VEEFGKWLDVTKAPMMDFWKIADDGKEVMNGIADAIENTKIKAIEAREGYKLLEDGLATLGIKGKQYYAEQVDIAQDAYDKILNSGLATDNELQQAAAILAQKQAEYALFAKEITVEQYREIVDQVNTDLQELEGNETESRSRRLSDEERFSRDVQQINH